MITSVASASVDDAKAALDAAQAAFAGWAERSRANAPKSCARPSNSSCAAEQLRPADHAGERQGAADARGEVAYAAEFFRWYAEEAVRNIGRV